MKIATFNVNGITSRLPRVLEWLAEAQPDIACLQELKTLRRDLSAPGRSRPRATARSGTGRRASTASPCCRATAAIWSERRRGLPGDPDDTHSRYLEASAHGMVVASIYLPNGNPQPGPKFDYKLAWFERLIEHAASLIDSAEPVLLVGDYNVVATDGKGDIYNPASWQKDALLQPESRDAYRRLLAQGWTDAIHALHEGEPIYTFWDYFRDRFARDAGLRIDHLLLNAPASKRLRKPASTARCAAARSRATTRRRGWCSTETAKRRAIDTRRFGSGYCGPWLYGLFAGAPWPLNLAFVRAPKSRIRSALRWPKFLVATTARLVSVLIVFFSSASGELSAR